MSQISADDQSKFQKIFEDLKEILIEIADVYESASPKNTKSFEDAKFVRLKRRIGQLSISDLNMLPDQLTVRLRGLLSQIIELEKRIDRRLLPDRSSLLTKQVKKFDDLMKQTQIPVSKNTFVIPKLNNHYEFTSLVLSLTIVIDLSFKIVSQRRSFSNRNSNKK